MILKCTNISKAVCTFLDLRISVLRGQFRYMSFDMRNDFSFGIVKYPDLSGNIPAVCYVIRLVRTLCYQYYAWLWDNHKWRDWNAAVEEL